MPADDPADTTPQHPVEPPASTEMMQTIQRHQWTRNIAIGVAAAVLLIAVGWISGAIVNQFRTPESEVALQAVLDAPDALEVPSDTQGGPEGTIAWSDALDTAVLTVKGLPELAAGEEFAVWYLADTHTPQLVGTFLPETGTDAGSATVELSDIWQDGDVLTVTVERSQGLSAGEPSDDSVFIIDSTDDSEPAEED